MENLCWGIFVCKLNNAVLFVTGKRLSRSIEQVKSQLIINRRSPLLLKKNRPTYLFKSEKFAPSPIIMNIWPHNQEYSAHY